MQYPTNTYKYCVTYNYNQLKSNTLKETNAGLTCRLKYIAKIRLKTKIRPKTKW
jgi:hypothetical protein